MKKQVEFQVNISTDVEGNEHAWVGRHYDDTYVGRLTDTVYADGVSYTDWCEFVGTEQECQDWADAYNAD